MTAPAGMLSERTRHRPGDRETELRRLGAELRKVPRQLPPPAPAPLHVIARRRTQANDALSLTMATNTGEWTMQSDDQPPVREEVIDLLGDVDPYATPTLGMLMHGDGRPFTDRETQLYRSVTPRELGAYLDRMASSDEYQQRVAADQVRLHEIARNTSEEISDRFTDGIIRHGLAPGMVPDLGTEPVRDTMRRLDRRVAALIHVFRTTVLPDISGPARAEAEEILERLAPYELLYPGSEFG